jgi:hypothetical protein
MSDESDVIWAWDLDAAQKRTHVRQAQAMAAATKRDIIRVLRRSLTHQEPLEDPGAPEAAVEAFMMQDRPGQGFKVEFRVAIDYRTFAPHIFALASFRWDEKGWEIVAIRVSKRGRIRIEFDHMQLQCDVDEAVRFCDALF